MASVTGRGEGGGGGVCVTQVHGRTEPGRRNWIVQLILMHIIEIFCSFFQLFDNILQKAAQYLMQDPVRPASNLACEKGGREKGEGKGEGRRVQERKIGESAFNGSQVARPSVRPPCVHVRPPSRCLCSLRRRRGRAARSVIVIKGALLSSA